MRWKIEPFIVTGSKILGKIGVKPSLVASATLRHNIKYTPLVCLHDNCLQNRLKNLNEDMNNRKSPSSEMRSMCEH